jgi:hypothetical protein
MGRKRPSPIPPSLLRTASLLPTLLVEILLRAGYEQADLRIQPSARLHLLSGALHSAGQRAARTGDGQRIKLGYLGVKGAAIGL